MEVNVSNNPLDTTIRHYADTDDDLFPEEEGKGEGTLRREYVIQLRDEMGKDP